MSDRPLECSSEEHKLSGRTDHGTGWEHYNDQSQQENVLEGKYMVMCSLNVRHISKIIHTSNLWKVGRVKGEMVFSRVVTKSLFLQQVKAVVLVTFDVVMDCRHCCYFNGGRFSCICQARLLWKLLTWVVTWLQLLSVVLMFHSLVS